MNEGNNTHRAEYAHLLQLLGAKDHQDAGAIIGALHGQSIEADRLRDAAEKRQTVLEEQTRMLWLVIRAAGDQGSVRVNFDDAAATDWSRAALQRTDDLGTRDMVLTAILRRYESDGPADDEDALVEAGDDAQELQRALALVSEALGSQCELDDMLQSIDRLQREAEDANRRADVYAGEREAMVSATAKIAEQLGTDINPAAEAIKYHNAVGPIDSLYAVFSAMDTNDTPLEEWPKRAIEALALCGLVVVPESPTPRMIECGVAAGIKAAPEPWCPVVWAAMLKAAPLPQHSEA